MKLPPQRVDAAKLLERLSAVLDQSALQIVTAEVKTLLEERKASSSWTNPPSIYPEDR